jgi:hypothetical protein
LRDLARPRRKTPEREYATSAAAATWPLFTAGLAALPFGNASTLLFRQLVDGLPVPGISPLRPGFSSTLRRAAGRESPKCESNYTVRPEVVRREKN